MKAKGTARPVKDRGPGRPPVITLAVVERVSELMALGMPEEDACALAGVNAETYGPAVSRSPEFKAVHRLNKARFMERALRAIANGGEIRVTEDEEGNAKEERVPWTGLAWILERRHKPHFNKREELAHGVAGAGVFFSADEERMLEEMAKELFVRGAGQKRLGGVH